MLKFYVTHGQGKKTTKSDLHFPSKLYYFFVRAFVSVLQTSTKNQAKRSRLGNLSRSKHSLICTPIKLFWAPVLTPTFMELKYINIEITSVF